MTKTYKRMPNDAKTGSSLGDKAKELWDQPAVKIFAVIVLFAIVTGIYFQCTGEVVPHESP